MAAQTSPQLQAVGETSSKPIFAGGEQPPPLTGYNALFKPATNVTSRASKLKEVTFVHGEPTITFDSSDIATYIQDENLQFALLAKFSYGKPDMPELRKLFPQQMGIKGECNLGLLDSRHILVRLFLHEDFLSLYSRVGTNTLLLNNGKGIKFPFRIQRWTPKFNPKEETSIALAWISFPNLPVQFFAREALFSLASAIGTPLAVDKATNTQSRPSVARVKVEVDLLSSLPERIRLRIKEDGIAELQEIWQKVVYDRLPSYCTTCNHQGHKDEVCRWNIDQQTSMDSKNDGKKIQGDLRDKLNDKRKNRSAEITAVKPIDVSNVEMGQQTNQNNGITGDQTGQQTFAGSVDATIPDSGQHRAAGEAAGSLGDAAGNNGHQMEVYAGDSGQQIVAGKSGQQLTTSAGKLIDVQNDVAIAAAGNQTPDSVGKILQQEKTDVAAVGKQALVLSIEMQQEENSSNSGNGWTVVTKRKPGRSQIFSPSNHRNSAVFFDTGEPPDKLHKDTEVVVRDNLIAADIPAPSQTATIAPTQLNCIGVQILESLNPIHALNDAWLSKFGQIKRNVQLPKETMQLSSLGDNCSGNQKSLVPAEYPQTAGVQEHSLQHVGLNTSVQEIPSQIQDTSSENHDSQGLRSVHVALNTSAQEIPSQNQDLCFEDYDLQSFFSSATKNNKWADVVEATEEQEGDNIGDHDTAEISTTKKVNKEQAGQQVLDRAAGLSPNAPIFVPSNFSLGKHVTGALPTVQPPSAKLNVADRRSNAQKITRTDTELLDALVKTKSPAPINISKQLHVVGTSDWSSKIMQDIDSFEKGEEEEILDRCFNNAAREAGLSPRQQRSGKSKNKNKTHGRNFSWDDKVSEEVVPRQLPMRQAKLKVAAPTTSTKSNRSKKN